MAEPTTVIAVAQTPEEKAADNANIALWRKRLMWGAIAFVVLTIVFQLWTSLQSSETTVTTDKKAGTVSTTMKQGPPDTLVSTCAGGAAALLVAAAFYGRLKKFSIGGADFEFTEISEPEKQAVDARAAVFAQAVKDPSIKAALADRGVEEARARIEAGRRAGLTPVELADVSVSAAARGLKII